LAVKPAPFSTGSFSPREMASDGPFFLFEGTLLSPYKVI
jgi:hypothetical protein